MKMYYDVMKEFDIKVCACAICSGGCMGLSNKNGISGLKDQTRMAEAFAYLKKFDVKYDVEYLERWLDTNTIFSHKLIQDIMKAAKRPSFGIQQLEIDFIEMCKRKASEPGFDPVGHLNQSLMFENI